MVCSLYEHFKHDTSSSTQKSSSAWSEMPRSFRERFSFCREQSPKYRHCRYSGIPYTTYTERKSEKALIWPLSDEARFLLPQFRWKDACSPTAGRLSKAPSASGGFQKTGLLPHFFVLPRKQGICEGDVFCSRHFNHEGGV